MCNLVDMLAGPTCSGDNLPGVEGLINFIPVDEVTTEPTESSGTAAGDSVRLTGAWTLVTTTGLGYWRRFRLAPTGNSLVPSLTGAKGNLSLKMTGTFKFLGLNPEQFEALNGLVNRPLIGYVPDRSGQGNVIGSKAIPLYLESVEGANEDEGDERSMTLVFSCLQRKARFWTGSLDITPNT